MQPEKRKILVVVESIDVEDSSGSKANVALIQNLEKAGFKLLVYHYTRKEIDLKNIKCFRIKEKRFNILFLLSRLQRRFQHNFHVNLAKYLEPKFGFSFTFYNDVLSIAESLKNIKGFNPQIVLTLSKGASFRPHYALLKVPKFHNRWMAYVHDPYPFHFYPEPYNWSEPGYSKKIDFFKAVSEKCRWAAFPSLLLKDWMSKHFPAFNFKGIVIPHQMEKNRSSPSVIPIYYDQHKFTLLHAGTLLKQRSPIYLLEAFKIFLQKNPDAEKHCRLLFLGSCPDHQRVLAKYKNEFPQIYVSSGYVPFDEVRLLQKNVNVNIILEAPANISPFLPGKFPHCIAANRPILLLSPSVSESRRILGEDYPYWAETRDIASITSILEELYTLWKSDSASLQLNRKDVEGYLSLGSLKSTLENVLS